MVSSIAIISFRTSPGSAWRPSAFFEKISLPFTITSKTPPLLGISVHDSINASISRSLRISSVRLTARGVYFQAAQYSSVISINAYCIERPFR